MFADATVHVPAGTCLQTQPLMSSTDDAFQKLRANPAFAGKSDDDQSCGGPLQICTSSGEVRIGDVAVGIREGSRREMVPHPHFVPISGHVSLLRELLIDWCKPILHQTWHLGRSTIRWQLAN